MSKKILIVEDEVSLLKVLGEKFKIEGFDVFLAQNGQEGLLLAKKEKPDIILLDIVMPVMDGLTMLKKVRADEEIGNTKVIMLTNLSGPDNIAQALEGQSYDYLIKSNWKIEEVVKKIEEKLK